LSQGLPGLVIATIKTHGVVDGEPRMSQAQEVLGKRLVMRPSFRKRPMVRWRRHSARRAVSWTGRW
jgi:hypothetical protein